MRATKVFSKREAGIALLTTLLLLLLMSSLLVGFVLLVSSGQKLSGINSDSGRAFYAAEAGMEKLTADLGSLFDTNYAPSAAQINAITMAPPTISGVQYVRADGTSGYQITYQTDPNGNPLATISTIKSGPYQGMTALATPYTLTVTSHTTSGSEVKLQRTTQTVGIPMFQFGLFCDPDCSFFPGPVFNFGGRMHTNGNLFLAAGAKLTMSDRVTAVKDIIRTNLPNGFPTATQYGGTVDITTSPGTANFRALGMNEGSLIGTVGSTVNPNWNSISLGATNYAGNLRNGKTGAKKLDLGIVTLGQGLTQPIDVIRRPVPGENAQVTGSRYFAEASVKILLSDNPADIMSLPCIDTTTQPFNLADLAGDPTVATNWSTANAIALKNVMNANNAAGLSTIPVPLAASGAANTNSASNYTTQDGYWIPKDQPIITGYLKIEVQLAPFANPCSGWRDVTIPVLGLGYAGMDINPVPLTNTPAGQLQQIPDAEKTNPINPGQLSQVEEPTALTFPTLTNKAVPCLDPHPNAVIRLERVRDNPSNYAATANCGVTRSAGKITVVPTNPTDYWPNVLFDTREGLLRDFKPSHTVGIGVGGPNGAYYSQMVPLGGVMHYIELDAKNLAAFLSGALPGGGNLSFDPNIAPNDFVVYISDRRGNYVTNQTWSGTWPPLSPSRHETGEYGFSDFINAANAINACPNGTVDQGEDLDQTGWLYLYGQDSSHSMSPYTPLSPWSGGYGPFTPNLYGAAATNALTADPQCSVNAPTQIWPMTMVIHANEARENPNFFFRRAVKITDGSLLNLGVCPGGVPCGLTVAAENPVYIQGDFNANSAGAGFNDPHVATSVVADAVTLLSSNWNDYNSFYAPYDMKAAPNPIALNNPGARGGVTTYYRVAVVGGKGLSFPQPPGNPQDYGTDGGVHNFLRYLETWSGQTLNYRGSMISLYYNRQAIGTYKCCTTVYEPPTRGYNFDVEFLTPSLLPPRTPLFRDVNTTGFTQLLLPNQ